MCELMQIEYRQRENTPTFFDVSPPLVSFQSDTDMQRWVKLWKISCCGTAVIKCHQIYPWGMSVFTKPAGIFRKYNGKHNLNAFMCPFMHDYPPQSWAAVLWSNLLGMRSRATICAVHLEIIARWGSKQRSTDMYQKCTHHNIAFNRIIYEHQSVDTLKW